MPLLSFFPPFPSSLTNKEREIYRIVVFAEPSWLIHESMILKIESGRRKKYGWLCRMPLQCLDYWLKYDFNRTGYIIFRVQCKMKTKALWIIQKLLRISRERQQRVKPTQGLCNSGDFVTARGCTSPKWVLDPDFREEITSQLFWLIHIDIMIQLDIMIKRLFPLIKLRSEEHSSHCKFKNFSLCKMYRHRQVLEWLGLQFCIFLVGGDKSGRNIF